MTPNTVEPRTLVSDESIIGCTLDEVSVVVLGDRLVVVPIAREAAAASGFELAEVTDQELLVLGVLPRASAAVLEQTQPQTSASAVGPVPLQLQPVQPVQTVQTVQSLPVQQMPVQQIHAPAGGPSLQSQPVVPVPTVTVQATPVPTAASATQPALSGSDSSVPNAGGAESRGFSKMQVAEPPVPTAASEPRPAASPAFAAVASPLAPAPAPDFSAWPYVDRRTLTADDDVPTAQNFLNTAIASERRGRNADVAAAPSAPFGDVPRSYESVASDTRAKPEVQSPNMPSTVAIGIASLPKAPEPTVVPSPVAATPSVSAPSVAPSVPTALVSTPSVSPPLVSLPEPTVLEAPAVSSASTIALNAPLEALVPSPGPAAVESPAPLEGHVDDIADSPLARLLAGQAAEAPPDLSDPVALEPLVHVPGTPEAMATSPVVEKAAVSNSPFAAPKVGRTESLFDSPRQSVSNPLAAAQVPSLWKGEGQSLPHELTPMSPIFGLQTAPSETLQALPAATPLASPVETLEALPPVTPLADIRSVNETQPIGVPEQAEGSERAEPLSPTPSVERAAVSELSTAVLQDLHGFEEEHPDDLVPLGVSDRLVLRWHANAAEDLRVSSVGLSVGWPSSKPLVSKLDIDLQSGDILVVEGPERSGKTALLKTFAGHLAPLAGDVSLDGQSLGSTEGTDFRRREALSLSYVGVNSLLVADLSLVENIELPLLAEGVSPHDARPAALAWLESVGLSANAHLPAGSLSSSDARIGAVIRTLIVGPALVCVDDVTSGMGISSARMVLALLEHAQGTGTVLLVATNDVRLEFDGGYRAAIEAGELMPVE